MRIEHPSADVAMGSFLLTIEQYELIRRLRASGITKDQVVLAFDQLDRLDHELGGNNSNSSNCGGGKSAVPSGASAGSNHNHHSHHQPHTTIIREGHRGGSPPGGRNSLGVGSSSTLGALLSPGTNGRSHYNPSVTPEHVRGTSVPYKQQNGSNGGSEARPTVIKDERSVCSVSSNEDSSQEEERGSPLNQNRVPSSSPPANTQRQMTASPVTNHNVLRQMASASPPNSMRPGMHCDLPTLLPGFLAGENSGGKGDDGGPGGTLPPGAAALMIAQSWPFGFGPGAPPGHFVPSNGPPGALVPMNQSQPSSMEMALAQDVECPDLEDLKNRKGEAALLSEIRNFVMRYNIKQTMIAEMTKMSQAYVSRFFRGDIADMSERTKNTFYMWYLTCKNNPWKLEEFLKSWRPALVAAQLCPNSGVKRMVSETGDLIPLKRERFTFKSAHLAVLERYYERDPYPDAQTREQIVDECNKAVERHDRPLSDREKVTLPVVNNWFNNRRKEAKKQLRQQHAAAMAAAAAAAASTAHGGSIGPPPSGPFAPHPQVNQALNALTWQQQLLKSSANVLNAMAAVGGNPNSGISGSPPNGTPLGRGPSGGESDEVTEDDEDDSRPGSSGSYLVSPEDAMVMDFSEGGRAAVQADRERHHTDSGGEVTPTGNNSGNCDTDMTPPPPMVKIKQEGMS